MQQSFAQVGALFCINSGLQKNALFDKAATEFLNYSRPQVHYFTFAILLSSSKILEV